jgi:hypothetical protein
LGTVIRGAGGGAGVSAVVVAAGGAGGYGGRPINDVVHVPTQWGLTSARCPDTGIAARVASAKATHRRRFMAHIVRDSFLLLSNMRSSMVIQYETD